MRKNIVYIPRGIRNITEEEGDEYSIISGRLSDGVRKSVGQGRKQTLSAPMDKPRPREFAQRFKEFFVVLGY